MPSSLPRSSSPLPHSLCVFCGSALGSDPVFAQAAQELGKILADNKIRLVYGGGSRGLMGEVAQATFSHGGEVMGIIPEFLLPKENPFMKAQELIITKDMHERKRLMFEKSDGFIALPGGIGTLEEVVEQLTWLQLGQHHKPIVFVNIADFWKPLLVLFAHMRQNAFIRPEAELRYLVIDQVEDVLPMIAQYNRLQKP